MTQITLAWILATAPESTVRDGSSALDWRSAHFRAAAARNLLVFRVLAAAYAESGQFPAAIQSAEEGVERAEAQGQSTIVQLLEGDLALYQQSIPVRDQSHGRGVAGSPK